LLNRRAHEDQDELEMWLACQESSVLSMNDAGGGVSVTVIRQNATKIACNFTCKYRRIFNDFCTFPTIRR